MKEKTKNQVKTVLESFIAFEEAYNNCQEAISNLEEVDINELICGDKDYTYPFDKSFDEIPIHQWIASIVEQCNKKLSEK